MPVTIWTTPVEVPDQTPFELDLKHAAYDPEYAQRFWRILAQANRVLTKFHSRFIGKVSPVHFLGSISSDRRAFFRTQCPFAPYCSHFVMVEAYSHEVVVVSGLVVDQLMNWYSVLMRILSLRASRITQSSRRKHFTIVR
jgi:uncharacterized protein DUF5996